MLFLAIVSIAIFLVQKINTNRYPCDSSSSSSSSCHDKPRLIPTFPGCSCPEGYAFIIDTTSSTAYCRQMCFKNAQFPFIAKLSAQDISRPNVLQCLGEIILDRSNCTAIPYVVQSNTCNECGSLFTIFNGITYCVAALDPAIWSTSTKCPGSLIAQPVIVNDIRCNVLSGLQIQQLVKVPCPTCSPCVEQGLPYEYSNAYTNQHWIWSSSQQQWLWKASTLPEKQQPLQDGEL